MTQLTQEIVRELISYDPETGIARWKPRSAKWFKSSGNISAETRMKMWNSKNSNKEINYVGPDGYICFNILSQHNNLHRIIWLYMTGEPPKIIDHIDGDKSNNKWNNLRDVDYKVNGRNTSMKSTNTSGFVGVQKLKSGKFRGIITFNGKSIHLGYFDCIIKASEAVKKAHIKYNFHPNHGRR